MGGEESRSSGLPLSRNAHNQTLPRASCCKIKRGLTFNQNYAMSGDLCEELIVEIFTRLPTKSLLRFRSVSKWLCARIGSPNFIRLHTLRSPNKAMIMHYIRIGKEQYEDHVYTIHSNAQLSSSSPYTGITPVKYPFDNSIVGSCNGILCVDDNENAIYLWNPSIRRKVTVHRPPSCRDGWYRNTIGFGFDPTIDDYKIVMLARPDAERRNAYVYTMKTDAWREIAYHATSYSCVRSTQCLYNGSLHWIAKGEVAGPRNYDYSYIMAFDLRSEAFSKIELSEPRWETNEVGVIDDCLAVISSNFGDYYVWVRREGNNTAASWSIAFILKANEVVGEPMYVSPLYANEVVGEPIFFCQLNANDDLLLYSYVNGVVVYNPKTRLYSKLETLRGCHFTDGVYSCVESLELLDMGSSCDDQGKQVIEENRSSESEVTEI